MSYEVLPTVEGPSLVKSWSQCLPCAQEFELSEPTLVCGWPWALMSTLQSSRDAFSRLGRTATDSPTSFCVAPLCQFESKVVIALPPKGVRASWLGRTGLCR